VDPMRAVGVVLILAAACGESTAPSAAGAVRVQVWAAGGISLGEEYRVRLDGRSEVPVSEPAGALFSPVSSGEHLVTLDGYPARCQVDQGPARTVVTPGATVVTPGQPVLRDVTTPGPESTVTEVRELTLPAQTVTQQVTQEVTLPERTVTNTVTETVPLVAVTVTVTVPVTVPSPPTGP